MAKFMIELPHSRDDCADMLMNIAERSPEFMGGANWGCISGNHTGWGIVEADNIAQVRDLLPDDLRDTASITEINQYTADEVKSKYPAA
ncbi:MAG: hypothetical protein ACYC27_11125 [Armatimonadota bacterium]